MKKLSFTLVILLSVLGIDAQYSWNGATPGGTTASGGAGTWNTTGSNTNWLMGTTHEAWPAAGGQAATFGVTGGLVTLGSAVSATGITFGASGYTIAPGGFGLTLTGSPTITIPSGYTETISAPITTGSGVALIYTSAGGSTITNLSGTGTYGSGVTIAGTGGGTFNFSGSNTFASTLTVTQSGGPKLNFSGGTTFTGAIDITVGTSTPTLTFSAPCTFTGGIAISLGTTSVPALNFSAATTSLSGGITVNQPSTLAGNVAGAFGPSGSAGTISIASSGTGTVLSNASSQTAATDVIYNNVSLNSSGTGYCRVAIGATKASSGVFEQTWAGAITGAKATVYLGNQVTSGTGGAGLTSLTNSGNTWADSTVFNASANGAFQCGVRNCLPTTTTFVYGNTGSAGIVDLNGYTLTVGSLSDNVSSSSSAITSSVNTSDTLIINGGGIFPATFTSVIGAFAANANSVIPTATYGNITVVMSGTAGQETFTGANTFTGGLILNAGTFVAGAVNTLAATLPVAINGGTLNTGAGAGFTEGSLSQPLGTLTVGSSGGTLALGTGNSIYFTNSNSHLSGPAWSGTLDITGWTGSNHIFIGNDGTGLYSSQLSQITFTTGTYAGQHANILSTGEIVPTGAAVIGSLAVISPASGSEGGATTFTITVNATGVPTNGSTVTYTITGINASQVVGGSLTGTVTFNGSSTSATATFTVQNDAQFEGTKIGTVAISAPTGNISTVTATTQNFTLYDAASFYWNGGTPTAGTGLTPNGGTGTWDVANSWVGVVSGSTGTGTTWQDGYPAYLVGSQGTISINGATTNSLHPSSITVTTGGDIITPNSATTDTLAGNLIVGSTGAVNLVLNDPSATTARTLVLTDSSITGNSGSTITVGGAQGSGTTVYSDVQLQPTAVSGNYTTNIPFVMNGTGAGYVVLNFNGGNSGPSLSSPAGSYTLNGGVQIASTNTAGVVIGGTAGYNLTVNGITAPAANTSPVLVSNKPSGSGKGTFTFEGSSNYYGPTFLATNTGGTVLCVGNNTLSQHSVLNIGSPNSSGQGPNLDLNGTTQTIAGLRSTSGATGEITDSSASAAASVVINMPTATVDTFSLPILNGSLATTSVELSGVDNTSSLMLKSAGNTFTGGLKIDAFGDLIAGATNTLASALPVTLNGGTLGTGIGYSQSVGSFTLSANSTINLGSTNAHSLKFSSLASWPTSDTLTINGWVGTAGVSGTKGQFFIGTTGTVLSAAQLGAITFTGFLPGATQLSTGEIVPNTAITTLYSQTSGKAGADAIWSYLPVGTPQTAASLIGSFNSTVSLVIQNGHTVTTGSSEELKANNLTINTGGELKENTTSSATPYYIDVYGNLTVNGKLGLLNGGDSLALNVNGATTTISGTGTINLQRIRNNVGSNNLTIGANIDLWWSGTSLYNGTSNSTFNVTVNSGSTVDFEGTGDLSIVGIAGASSNRAGTFTVNGTMKGIDTLYGYSLVTTIGTTGYVINSGGLMAADYVLLGIGGVGNMGFAVNSGGELNVNTNLQLQSGNFAPQGTVLMKSSSVNAVAILDNFSSGSFTGTYTGQMTAERYYASSSTYNQHYMGSPVDAPALTQFGASGTPGYVTPEADCDETKIATHSAYGTVFSYHESNGAACYESQWKVETSGNATDGLGYSVLKTGSGTLSLTGAPNLNSSYTISNLTNTGWSNTSFQGHGYDAGWQLVSNPYLAPLNITTTNPGFDNQIQVWNANGPYAGSFQPSTVIAPFQAFMVHMTNPGSGGAYTINASSRVIAANTFYNENANQLTLVTTNAASGLMDQTTVGFNANATNDFDPQFDANKFPGSLNRQTLYSVNSGKWMSKNILNSIEANPTVCVGFEPGATGTYSVSFNGINSFDATSYIYLEDKALNVMHNVRSGNYTFTADSADNWNRFVLHFSPAAQITTVNGTCAASGSITVQQPGSANWNYTLTDANNAVVTTGVLNQNQPFTVGVAPGTYTLTLTDVNNYTAVKVIQVNGSDVLGASINTSSDEVQTGQIVTVNASANDASSYVWNLGNGTTANGADATVTYTQPGVYTLSLVVSNGTGCSATVTKTITVIGATGVSNLGNSRNVSIWSSDNTVFVDFTSLQTVDATVTLYNILGQELSTSHCTNNNLYQMPVDNIDAAYIIVMVRNNDQITTKKVLITNSK